MTGPLVVLAIPAVVAGFWGSAMMGNGFQHFLEGRDFHGADFSVVLAAGSAVLALAGIALAWGMYGSRVFPVFQGGALYRVLLNRYYVDEIYAGLISLFVIGVGQALAFFDRGFLDGIVNGVARLTRGSGGGLRTIQTGRVQNYGLLLFGGMVAIAVAFFIPALQYLVKR
jgi:NADH-quinone oxidoreductase subunit L